MVPSSETYSIVMSTNMAAVTQNVYKIYFSVVRSTANTLGSLCLELSEKPNEYSYFKSSVLATWAGPEHWKMKARLSKCKLNLILYTLKVNKY